MDESESLDHSRWDCKSHPSHPNPKVTLKSITMNEGDTTNTYDGAFDGTIGDGNTTSDVQDAVRGTYDLSFALRAERSGTGPGRVYTITYTATDASGNSADASAKVTVPHNQ
jgi:hypothetical protein